MVTFFPKVGGWRYSGEFKKTSGVLMGSLGGNKGELSGGPEILLMSYNFVNFFYICDFITTFVEIVCLHLYISMVFPVNLSLPD